MAHFDELKEEGRSHLERLQERLVGVEAQLAKIARQTESDRLESTYRNVFGRGTVLAGQTDVAVTLEAVPPGAYWLIEQITTTGTALGPVAVYLDQITPDRLIYFVGNAQIQSAQGPLELYVRERQQVIFHFYAQTAAQVCTVFMQLKQFTESPSVKAINAGD